MLRIISSQRLGDPALPYGGNLPPGVTDQTVSDPAAQDDGSIDAVLDNYDPEAITRSLVSAIEDFAYEGFNPATDSGVVLALAETGAYQPVSHRLSQENIDIEYKLTRDIGMDWVPDRIKISLPRFQ